MHSVFAGKYSYNTNMDLDWAQSDEFLFWFFDIVKKLTELF